MLKICVWLPYYILTAQAQNAVPRMFVFCFLTYQTSDNSNALFNLRLPLVFSSVNSNGMSFLHNVTNSSFMHNLP